MSDGASPQITLRALEAADAAALYALDYSFETDYIYTLGVQGTLQRVAGATGEQGIQERFSLKFELVETPVDPPFYKDYRVDAEPLEKVQQWLQESDGGYVALVDDEVAGGVLLRHETWRTLVSVRNIIVGRQFRRYGIGSLLLNCASDWARNQDCHTILLETQNTNYPAVQFYLRNGFEVWGIDQHYYPAGPVEHEIALFLGKYLR